MDETPGEGTFGSYSADQDDNDGPDARGITRGLVTLLLIGLATAFAVQNSDTVEVTFLSWDFTISKILLMVASALVGVVLWLLLSRLIRRNKSN